MKTYLRIFALFLAALLCGMMVGCSKAPTGEQAQEQEKSSPSEAASSSAASEPVLELVSEPSDGSSSGRISHYDRPAEGVVVESVEAKDGVCTVVYRNFTDEVCHGGAAWILYLVLEGELRQIPTGLMFEESIWILEPGAKMEQRIDLNAIADDLADGMDYRIVKTFSSETETYEAWFDFRWPLTDVSINY